MNKQYSSIDSSTALREHYAFPSARAIKKSLGQLEKHCIHFISKSPFAIISTCDAEGNMDASPRGGNPGFVKVLDQNTILIPDSKGNNRLDSLLNIIDTGHFASLFLIPGMNETLRLNGEAYISSDPSLLSLFEENMNTMGSCIVVEIEEVFLHCAKAFMRSKLWESNSLVDRTELPTMGEMLNDQMGETGKLESQKEMEERYKKDL